MRNHDGRQLREVIMGSKPSPKTLAPSNFGAKTLSRFTKHYTSTTSPQDFIHRHRAAGTQHWAAFSPLRGLIERIWLMIV